MAVRVVVLVIVTLVILLVQVEKVMGEVTEGLIVHFPQVVEVVKVQLGVTGTVHLTQEQVVLVQHLVSLVRL
jgi:hypothetical protein